MTRLSHLDEKGEARMVDVTEKAVTQRTARAEGVIAMAPETLKLIEKGEAKKGDVLAAARIAGIMAAKRTHELIPLCHPLPITKAAVSFETLQKPPGIRVTAEVKVMPLSAQQGVSRARVLNLDQIANHLMQLERLQRQQVARHT